MPPPVLSISAARQEFFNLFETVTARRGNKVIITSRGTPDHAVLVGEAYLNELEAAAKRLRDIQAGKIQPPQDFRLMGSGRVARGGKDPLKDIRSDAHALWVRKLTSVG